MLEEHVLRKYLNTVLAMTITGGEVAEITSQEGTPSRFVVQGTTKKAKDIYAVLNFKTNEKNEAVELSTIHLIVDGKNHGFKYSLDAEEAGEFSPL